MLTQLREVAGDRLVAVLFREPFNFSAKCNLGFLHSRGDVIVLLNDDTEATSEQWLEKLVAEPLAEPDVGITGAKLVFPDGALQHAGHIYAPKPGERAMRHAFTAARTRAKENSAAWSSTANAPASPLPAPRCDARPMSASAD